MNTGNKIILSQAEAALIEGGLQAAQQVNKGIEEMEKKHQLGPDGLGALDKPVLGELDLIRAEQTGTELFGTYGIDGATKENYMRELAEKAGAPRTQQISIIQMIGQMSGEMGTTPQKLFPIVLAIYIRNKDVQLTQGILSIISRYESTAPGIGALEIAEKAALGQPVGQEMMQIRLALMALNGDYGSKGLIATKDLERAIYSIIAPQSQAGAEIMKTQDQRLRTQQRLEEFYTALGRVQSLYSRQRLKKVEDATRWLTNMFPTVANSAPFDWWYRTLHGVAAASTIKEHMVKPVFDPLSQGSSLFQQIQQTGVGRRASLNVDHILTAQVAPETPPPTAKIPNSDVSNQAAAQAQQANNAQVSDAVRASLPVFLINTSIGNSLMPLIDAFERGQSIIDSELKTLQELISKTGSTELLGDRANSAVYMTPEQFTGQADRVYNLATQQKTILFSILDLLTQALGSYGQADPQKGSLIQKLITDWRARHAKVDSNIVTAFELRLVGPIEQQIAMLAPQKEYLKQGIEMAAMINNIGADQYVGPFSALCMQISQLRMQASRLYMQVASNPQAEPQMKNYCLLRARQQMQAALLSRNEGTMAIMKMTQGIFGGQSLLPTANSDAWVKVGSELERDADAELEDYWNELYEDSPGAEGYGTALEHALEYHKTPTDEVPACKSKMRRK